MAGRALTMTSRGLERTEEGRRFLQIRTARFGLVVGGLTAVFLLFRVSSAAATGYLELLADPMVFDLAAGGASFLAIWLVLRRGSPSVGFIQTVETLGLLAATAFYVAMGGHMPLAFQPVVVVVLLLTLGIFGRAVWVPSTARRTFLVGGLVGVVLVVWSYYLFRGPVPSYLVAYEPSLADIEPEALAALTAASTAVWWLLTVGLTAAASATIYGLQREAQLARRLGQYTLVEPIGEGGMGSVYRARHALMRRPTAIKLLAPEKAGPVAMERFEREVQLTSRLSHPNTVTIYDYGHTPDGLFYYVMEYLDGPTLERVVEVDGPQSPARVVHILEQIAGALAEAHAAGLIHRDIKPNNVMLVQRGGVPDVVKVVDFGLVKDLDAASSTTVTQADVITGTPQYMAPEAIVDPAAVDARSDLYALGAVAYFLVTGAHVFEGHNIVEVCTHHLHSPPVPPSERLGASVPNALERLILDLLSKDPVARPQSADELLRRLEACAPDVGVWTHDDARRWWAELGDDVQRPTPGTGTGARRGTVTLDLGRRAGFWF
jgi:serine/threonine-protein kinase